MKLLHLISSLNPAAGGVSQAVVTMIKGLTAAGITSEVATTDPPDADYLHQPAFRTHAFGPGKSAWQYAPPLLQWLKTNLVQYDAVLVHGLWQYQTYAAYRAWKGLKGKKPRLLVMPHGMLDPYFQKAKGRKIKAFRNWLFWKAIEGKLVNHADAVLFTCETELLLAREPFRPYRPRKEVVAGLGVETPPAYHERMKTAFATKFGQLPEHYWLYISRIHEKKGVDLLIRTYLELKKQGRVLPPLVIAGPGLETAFGMQMQQLASANPAIHFPGMLTGDAKWGAFYGAAVFILPSHQENFGIAVVEALACGKPVLISDQVNIWREIKQAGAGIVCPDNLEGVSRQLQTWIDMPAAQKQEMEKNTSTCFETCFSVHGATRTLIQALNSNS